MMISFAPFRIEDSLVFCQAGNPGGTMRQPLFMLIVLSGLAISNCSGNNAEELFETAKLEELQDNREHAKRLYEDVIRAYPDSRYATEAQARLSALEQGR
jgi:hypothetical protein